MQHFRTGAALAAIILGTATVCAQAPAGKPQLGDFGYDAAGMDRSVAPGDDFYRFANGAWQEKTVIPADKSSWGGFGILRDLSDQRTRAIVEELAAKPSAAGSNASKIGDDYASFMDAATIEAKGAAPLKPDLARIAAIRDTAALSAAFAAGARTGVDVPVTVYVGQDLKDNTVYTAYLSQGGLGLPDRDYYLVDSPKFVEARAKYLTYIATMLRLAGIPDADSKAQAIYALEKRMAEGHWTRAQSRQVEKRYNPVAATALPASAPGIDWPAYLGAAGVAAQPQVIMSQPSAVAATAALVKSVPLATWKDYLAFHTIAARAPVLSKAFVEADFAFNGTVLSGTPQLKERWKRGVDMVNAGLGEAVGEIYVARYFPPESKAKADALVRNVIAAMDARLSRLTWMAPETKVKARAKLAAFTPKIGYPTKWRDYTALSIVRGDAYGNAVRAQAFEYQRDLDKIGKPVDRTEWGMTPQTVNAYANPVMNEVVFPAAILQPPFFDPNADPAVNYGAFGMVIGHELSHHFDDQGRKYDPTGKLADWWTPTDVARFKAYTDQVVKQYGAYEPLPGVHVNGELTLGENMADLAGLNVAHDAYRLSLGGKPDRVIDGFTGDQRFYLGFAQVWRTKTRDAALQQQLTTDPHTPGNWRAYVARNLDSWYDAFGAKPGQAYYLAPADRLRIW